MLVFAWSEANVEHIAKHGVTAAEAEHVVRNASAPYPRRIEDDKLLVWGRTEDGRHLQVVFIRPQDEDVDLDSLDDLGLLALAEGDANVIYVVHAMELTPRMKRRDRRRKR